jgi:drug/metabolite transporter (DMT)-like permease
MTSAQETSPLLQNQHGTTSTSPIPPSTTATNASTNQRHQETKGMIYMTLSALFFSFMSLLVSLTTKTLPSFEIVLFRGIIQTILGVIACRHLGISPFGQPDNRIRFLLFCRGLAGSVALGFFFYALSVMPLADATVVFFFGPTFTAILGRIVLKEPFGPLDAIASTITMCGVILVAKPTFLFSSPSRPPLPGPPGSEGDDITAALFVKQQEEDYSRLFGTLAGLCGAMCTAIVSPSLPPWPLCLFLDPFCLVSCVLAPCAKNMLLVTARFYQLDKPCSFSHTRLNSS